MRVAGKGVRTPRSANAVSLSPHLDQARLCGDWVPVVGGQKHGYVKTQQFVELTHALTHVETSQPLVKNNQPLKLTNIEAQS